MKWLAIVSGGMDSITMLYEYKESIGGVLNFMYGSKHNEKETLCAEYHANHLAKPFTRIDMTFLSAYLKSDLLLNGGEVPTGHYADPNMKKTVVPFRNGIMLSIAAGVAESRGLDGVAIANHFGDHTIYPDCRAAFIKPMSEAITEGTWERLSLFAPYTHLTKRDIALRGNEFRVPYERTYTCYKGGERHCGECGACTERREALEGFDPTTYMTQPLMPEAP